MSIRPDRPDSIYNQHAGLGRRVARLERSGGRGFGSASVHYSGSPVSDPTAIAHGLGVTPAAIIVTGIDSGGSVTAYVVTSADATNFVIQGADVSGANRGPGNLSVFWVAFS